MPWILIGFCFYLLVVLVAWFVKRELGMILFVLFLILFCGILWHHMTDALSLGL